MALSKMGPDKANIVISHVKASRTTKTAAADAAMIARTNADGNAFISKSNRESGIQILRLDQQCI